MQIPIDITAVLKAAADIDSAAATPLSVSVYVDETAPGDLAANVRAAFATTSAQARVSIAYFADGDVELSSADDMAVLVAGANGRSGAQAARLRAAGVPAMVVSTSPSLVGELAAAQGGRIPEGDLVAPGQAAKRSMVGEAVSVVGKIVRGSREGDEPADGVALEEPIALDEEMADSLNIRMGEWAASACREKKLAFALAFPFARKSMALDAVQATSLQNAGVGAVLFIPGADMPVMTLNQAKMLLQIAAAYGQPMSVERVKELAFVVGGAFACRAVARQAVGLVPGFGWAVKAAIGYAGTEAMGHAAIDYFEAGGNIAGLAGVVRSARDKAVDAARSASQTSAGQKAVAGAKDAVTFVVGKVRERV